MTEKFKEIEFFKRRITESSKTIKYLISQCRYKDEKIKDLESELSAIKSNNLSNN